MLDKALRKIELYIISLWLLFLLVAIKEFQFVHGNFSLHADAIWNFVQPNLISLSSLVLLLIGGLCYWHFLYLLKGSSDLPKTIKKIDDQNFEHLTFLTTYIVPFLRVKLEGRDLIMTVMLLIIIGAIFVRTNLFYKNPTLALLGYRLYKVDTAESAGAIFISKQPLQTGDTVHNIYLAENIYFVKK
ncbi:anti-phage protein KwaA [Mucilaginibacter myungsuensis]|uniref:Uncharacterized protein n=1 Tax=Mucilaginibacter myungsuensis TaxID=649104 RepID=A0A929L4I5_9SPHI|nr:anti-phage protein KwaA [Mucilaginibacter myungsuensis]MBE9663091.1 hypothetical protein [Mucilaginibacter myungsuensis]MDN3598726.1 anti-phage protein KwaA [Mucilaginibacter myungsuensis]